MVEFEYFSVQIPKDMADEIKELIKTPEIRRLGIKSVRGFVLWVLRQKLLELRPILSDYRYKKQILAGEIEVMPE